MPMPVQLKQLERSRPQAPQRARRSLSFSSSSTSMRRCLAVSPEHMLAGCERQHGMPVQEQASLANSSLDNAFPAMVAADEENTNSTEDMMEVTARSVQTCNIWQAGNRTESVMSLANHD